VEASSVIKKRMRIIVSRDWKIWWKLRRICQTSEVKRRSS
jgi:hypothetical protein